MPFLSSILSVALPVAKIAAQVLPQILGNLETKKLAESAEDPPISNTLLEFVGDERQQKVYAVNRTAQTLAVTFQNNVDTGGSTGVQSETFELAPRNAADVTHDVEANSNSGVISSNYIDGVAQTSNAMAGGPYTRLAMLSLPFVSTLAFTAFGGKVGFERETVTEPTRKFDRWTITSDSKLLSVLFNYKTQNGQEINFKADLEKENSASASTGATTYYVDTDAVGLTTGMLSEFNVTVESETVSFNALLSKREVVAIDQLPDHVRARLTVS